MDRFEIGQVLREIGAIIELTDPNPKKAIAYRRAAFSVEQADNLLLLAEKKELETLPGIGKEISRMVSALIKRGRLPYYANFKKKVPPNLLELTNIPGLSSKIIRILYEKYGISSFQELAKALEEEKLKGEKGFGPVYLAKLQKKMNIISKEGLKILLPRAVSIAEALKEGLKSYTKKVEVAGEVRRKLETVSEIVLVATSLNKKGALSYLKKHTFVKAVLYSKPNYCEILLKQGIKASLEIVDEEDFAYSFLWATGSKHHLQDLRKIVPLSFKKNLTSEEEIYQHLELFFIPPELREGQGEVEAAKTDDFSSLIKEEDLKGTFHCHTLASDGQNTIRELVAEARKIGWEYIGITDHSKSSYQAGGLHENELLQQIQEIAKINSEFDEKFRVFAGIECDILSDGELDFDDEILKQLDFVIVSVHSLFKQEEEEMTKRIIKAIENPYTTMVGHLTGRIIGIRDPYKLNISKVIDACIANQKIIELNAHPNRSDMDWRFWKEAQEKGLKCSINPDAHTLKELYNCFYGVNIARKGWLKKKSVINTLSLKEIAKIFSADNRNKKN